MPVSVRPAPLASEPVARLEIDLVPLRCELFCDRPDLADPDCERAAMSHKPDTNG